MPNSSFYLCCGLLAALFFSSCDPASIFGPQAGGANEKNLRVSYHRGACYGRCEIFTLDLYENGLLLYKGERFTDRPGLWETNIDRRRIVALLDSFERADFRNYPRVFRSQIPDAPSIEFTYKTKAGDVYKTSFKEQSTAELEALDLAMRRLASLSSYRKVSDEIPGSSLQPTANAAQQEIIVQLREGVNAQSWLLNYGKQNVRFKKQLAANSPYYLITADPNLMAAEELLDFLRRDTNVVSAQLNKEVKPR